ncbi:MAG: hypothetical protein ACMXYC_02280 [Candidatus Woesearchaeota archaeon]
MTTWLQALLNKEKKEEPVKTLLENHGFKEEKIEYRRGVTDIPTGFPDPLKHYRLWHMSAQHTAEEMYFWVLNFVCNDFGLYQMDKITDTFASSTSSSMFGDMQGRLTAQQSQVTQLLGTIGGMVKNLFPLVRELREIEERLGYYEDSSKKKDARAIVAEKTLKGIWIDRVEGGTQNPGSVIGLSREVGFTVLPDLFFGAPPLEEKDIEGYVNSLEFNEQVKNMLKRKLFQYYRWKQETHHELQVKQQYQIKYLAHHFQSTRLYMQYVKPYIKQVQMLQLQHQRQENRVNTNQAFMDSGYLINSYQGSLSEVETLVYGKPVGDKEDAYYPCILLHVFHRTQPSMDFHQKDAWHQKGPIHIGKTELSIRAYAWTKKDIENYKKYRQREELDMLSNIDNSLQEAMDALGDDMYRYLEKAGVSVPKKENKEEKREDKKEEGMKAWEPFVAIPKGMYEIVAPLTPNVFGKKKKDNPDAKQNAKNAGNKAKLVSWLGYNIYKKAHGMASW